MKTAKKTLITAALTIGIIAAGSGTVYASAAPNSDTGNGSNINTNGSRFNDNRASRDGDSIATNVNHNTTGN